jgi:hypothetical protein
MAHIKSHSKFGARHRLAIAQLSQRMRNALHLEADACTVVPIANDPVNPAPAAMPAPIQAVAALPLGAPVAQPDTTAAATGPYDGAAETSSADSDMPDASVTADHVLKEDGEPVEQAARPSKQMSSND